MAPNPRREGVDPAQRQRKYHRKSRLGCQNCKFRSVKCDEHKPSCIRCTSAGFTCAYIAGDKGKACASLEQKLQLARTGVFQFEIKVPPSAPKNAPASSSRLSEPSEAQTQAPNALPYLPATVPEVVGNISIYELKYPEVYRHEFFQKVMVKPQVSYPEGTYGSMIQRIGSGRQYLTHACMAMAHLHDNDIALSFPRQPSPERRASLAYHWYQATVHYKQKLSNPESLTDEDRSCLWTTCGLLSAASFAFVDSHDPKCVWPLSLTPGTELDWVHLNIGKRVVWKICHPENEGDSGSDGRDRKGFEVTLAKGVFPECLLTLLGIDESSTPETNPYLLSSSILSHLIPEPCDDQTVLTFIVSQGSCDRAFLSLLEEKEPRALLVIMLLYAKICVYEDWWITRRARVEGKSILMFLEKFHADNATIQELLEYPRAVFSLLGESTSLASRRSTYILDSNSPWLGLGPDAN